MPKLKCNTLLIAIAAATLSASAALADANPDDRSYLPPQAKAPVEQAAPHANGRVREAHYAAAHRRERHQYAHNRTRRHYAHRSGRRYYASRGFFPSIFASLFH